MHVLESVVGSRDEVDALLPLVLDRSVSLDSIAGEENWGNT